MSAKDTSNLTRRGVIAGAGAVTVLTSSSSSAGAEAIEQKNPILGHAIATIGVPDVAAAQAMYEAGIGLYEVNKGTVSKGVSESWGAPAMAGRPWVMMCCESGDPTFRIRIVQVDPVPGYHAMTTWGLNAIEMISEDIYAVNERVLSAGFDVIGEPRPLSEAYASVHAMQVRGPGEELFYYASDMTGENEFDLIRPKSPVDRIFNAVVGTPNIRGSRAFYKHVLRMKLGNVQEFKVRMVSDALGYDRDTAIEMGSAKGRWAGSSIEFDAYPIGLSGPRPRAPGQLPPGVSMMSLTTDDFDSLDVSYAAAPAVLYGGGRAATFVGPSGEWVEIIEDV